MRNEAKVGITIAAILVPLGLGSVLFYLSQQVSETSPVGPVSQTTTSIEQQGHEPTVATKLKPNSPLSKLWEGAYDLYEKEQYAEAEALIEPHWQALTEAENGCDLIVSIYAENKNMPAVEKAGRYCLQFGKASDTLFESLAYSMSFQGKAQEAIELLQSADDISRTARFNVAISRLHLMLGHDDLARKHYLDAVAGAEVWSMWVSYALKIPPLAGDKDFLVRLMELVVKKPDVNEKIEQRLLEAASGLASEESYKALDSRLKRQKLGIGS